MSKFVIAVDEDIEMIDGEQYDTVEHLVKTMKKATLGV